MSTATADAPVIKAEGLVKAFGSFRALDGLDLTVQPGEVHGFLGPNGAGKSTTIRVVLGLMRATAGHVELFGGDPWRDAAHLHRRLAYVAGDVALWPGLTGGQCLDVLGTTHGAVDRQRRARLVERFDLDPSKRVRDYSKGNRQKVALIAALAAEADLLVLDEPTSGLDPLMEQAFQECVRERREDGATVLLSSHIMAEVEALADRVSIIRRGRTVTSGSLAELRRHTRTTVRAVTVDDPAGLADADGVADHVSERLDGYVDSRFSTDPEHLDDVVGLLHRARIHTLTVTPPSLNALFLRNYGEALDRDETGEEPDDGSDDRAGDAAGTRGRRAVSEPVR
jgi:ABC-2 type transport system ATP-binding protein